jgi:Fumarylacetoacetase N-terminal domain 2
MKLATLDNGARDGRLVVVSPDLKRAADAAMRASRAPSPSPCR